MKISASKSRMMALPNPIGWTGAVVELEIEVEGVKHERDWKDFLSLGWDFGAEEAPVLRNELEYIGDDARAVECRLLAP